MTEFKLREYQSADYEPLMFLWEKLGLGGKQRGDTKVVIDTCIQIGGKLLILETIASNEIIGSAWMTYDGRRLHLHHIGVDTYFQGKGLGKFLTAECIKYAKEINCQIKLEVHRQNRRAAGIYKKLGFSYLGDYDIYIIRTPENIEP